MDTHIKLNSSFKNEAKAHAEKLGITLKEYIENALLYFYSNKINPVKYSPSLEFDTIQVVKKSTDRIIAFIKHQEQTLLLKILQELIRNKLFNEAQLSIMIDRYYEEKEQLEVQQQINEFISEQLKKINE